MLLRAHVWLLVYFSSRSASVQTAIRISMWRQGVVISPCSLQVEYNAWELIKSIHVPRAMVSELVDKALSRLRSHHSPIRWSRYKDCGQTKGTGRVFHSPHIALVYYPLPVSMWVGSESCICHDWSDADRPPCAVHHSVFIIHEFNLEVHIGNPNRKPIYNEY